MKRKIIGILICMFLIATVVPVVGSFKINMINETVLSDPMTNIGMSGIELQKLLAFDGGIMDHFGRHVSLDGNTALIAGGGAVYVFTRDCYIWTFQAKFTHSDRTFGFGCSVSLSGDTALIGAKGDEDTGLNSGAAYVFTRTGTTWSFQQKLLAFDGKIGESFGYSVSLSGDTALIGALNDDDNGVRSGSAYVFTRTGTTWSFQQKLLAFDGVDYDQFGVSVSLDGDTALIGAHRTYDNGIDSGSAYVFTRTGTTWTFQQELHAFDGVDYDYFGWSVSLDGDTALIGASSADNAKGSAYVFTRTGTTWSFQQKLLAFDGVDRDFFGYSVSLSGGIALIGALGDDDNDAASGSAYVFTRTGTTWTFQQKLLAFDGEKLDEFGCSVSLDGDTVLIGAKGDDDNDDGSGSAYVGNKGAVTVKPSEDSFVDSANPNDNFGDDIVLRVGCHATVPTPPNACRGYLKFDLSFIPPDACIKSAKLYLLCEGMRDPTDVGVHYLDFDTWSEDDIKWNSPSINTFTSAPTSTVTITSDGEWYVWDVTSDVIKTVGNDFILSEVLQTAEYSYPYGFVFFSKEYGDAVFRPYLEIDYCCFDDVIIEDPSGLHQGNKIDVILRNNCPHELNNIHWRIQWIPSGFTFPPGYTGSFKDGVVTIPYSSSTTVSSGPLNTQGFMGFVPLDIFISTDCAGDRVHKGFLLWIAGYFSFIYIY